MRKLVFAGLALSLVWGCGSKPVAKTEEAPELLPVAVDTAKVVSGDVRDLLSMDGSFALPEGSAAKLSPMVAGRLLKVLVKEGDAVTAGQLVAIVDTRVLAAQSSSATQAAKAASAQASQSEWSLKAAQADQASAVNTAKLGLETAIAERDSNVQQAATELGKLKAGARPQEIAQAEQAVTQARINRDKAKVDADRDQKLLAEGFVSGQQADSSRAAFQLADSALKQARAQLDLMRAGNRREDIVAASQRLQAARDLGDKKIAQAREALKQANQGVLSLQAKRQELAASKLSASQKMADSQAAMQSEKNGEVRASMSGRVVRRLLNPGDMADTTTPVVEVASEGSSVDYVGALPPADASRVSVGMPVVFSKIEKLGGRVIAVGLVNAQTGLATVRVRCDHVTTDTRAGAFATAQIVLSTAKGACVAPKEAILTRDGKQVVFVVKDGVAKLKEVSVGPEDNGKVAILKGVSTGDELVLVGQHELSDGAKVAPNKKEKGE